MPMTADRIVVALAVPLADGAALAWLYDRGEVLARQDEEDVARVQVALDKADFARFERRWSYQPE